METFWLIVAFIGILALAMISKLGPPVGPVDRSRIKVRFSSYPISKSNADTERRHPQA